MPALVTTETEYNTLSARVSALEAGGVPSGGGIPNHFKCIYDYGAVGDGVADDTVAYNNFITALNNDPKKRTGYLASGLFRLSAQPVAPRYGVNLIGDSVSTCALIRDYNGVAGVGLLDIRENGISARNFGIQSAPNRTGGSAISIVSSATYSCSFVTIEDMYLTSQGNNTWDNTIWIDGTAKTTPATGARDLAFRNVNVFGANGYSVYARGAQGWTWYGGGIFPASGTNAASGGLLITGTTAVPSVQVRMDIVSVAGINLTQCNDVRIEASRIGALAGVSINNDSTAADCRVIGEVSGTVAANWTQQSSYTEN